MRHDREQVLASPDRIRGFLAEPHGLDAGADPLRQQLECHLIVGIEFAERALPRQTQTARPCASIELARNVSSASECRTERSPPSSIRAIGSSRWIVLATASGATPHTTQR